MEIVCGIYKITNKINGKAYIGQSVNIYARWYQHKNSADDTPFHRAIKKYGAEMFEWEILEECLPEQLDEREKHYVEKYNTYICAENSQGYNLTPGGGSGKPIPVNQYDLNGNFIKKFYSAGSAATSVNKGVSQIMACCKHNCMSCGGYLWSFEGEKPHEYKNLGWFNKKSVDQYDLQGNYIQTFSSATEAENYINKNLVKKKVSKGQIIHCCEKDNTSSGGFMWRFHGDEAPKPYVNRYYSLIKQYDLKNNLIAIYESLHEASRITNISKGNICNCLNGKRNQAGGYIWKREVIKEK